MENVSHISSQKPGWTRTLLVQFTEHSDWPEVRKSLREIIAKCYRAREVKDNDPVMEPSSNWQKLRPGHPLTSAIIDYLRRHITCEEGPLTVEVQRGTDINGIYRASFACPTSPEPLVYMVKIKNAQIVKFWGANKEERA